MAAADGWNALFWCNHDQPHAVSRFGDDENYHDESAKMLAAAIHSMRGTPFIYEGQELGMTNVAWDSIEKYNDISSRGQYEIALNEGFSKEKALEFVHFFSRDNARTPMQWNSSENAGFTAGKPWLPIHDDYKICNAATEDADKNSVLNYFRKLNAFRANSEILLFGDYEELLRDDENIFAFARAVENKKIYVLANFTLNEVTFPTEILGQSKFILGNYTAHNKGVLKPLEVVLYKEATS